MDWIFTYEATVPVLAEVAHALGAVGAGRRMPRGEAPVDTARVPMDLKGALAALDAHEPDALLGLREGQWIDAKKAP
ncbi:hypothetical protein ABZ092_33805 [Streptomyces bobili]|uniref:hypothetical protein n=1 Tax=Streptomyces bobili TaxID=67280 RepID=UPI0033A72691